MGVLMEVPTRVLTMMSKQSREESQSCRLELSCGPDQGTSPSPSQSERRDLFETSVSFSIVRHPFERLVSAFQDKIVDQSDGWYANRVKYLKVEYVGVSFAHFAEMILDKSVKVC